MTNKMDVSNSKQTQENSNQNGKPEAKCDNENTAECGLGKFKPTVLKMCATIPVFTGVYSFSTVMTQTLSTYVNSQVTTLEKHFGFSSSQTGLIMAANEIGFLVVILFVSFVATQVHIPRALGIFTILFGVSGILCALPHFLFGAPSPSSLNGAGATNISTSLTSGRPSGSFTGQLCDGANHALFNCSVLVEDNAGQTQGTDPVNPARANSGTALIIILVGMILQGVAKSPRSAFTTFYVDSNVPKEKTGFFMGIIIAAAILGPGLAFTLGGLFSRIYVTLEDTNLHFRHPKWVGAWWLGFLMFGAAACVTAIPLFCFPRRMMKTQQEEQSDQSPTEETVGSPIQRAIQFMKGFFKSLFRVLRNPVYMCTELSACAMIFSVAGGQAFNPKYIENQFAFPVWKANIANAALALGAGCLGAFVGGYVTKRLKMGPVTSLKFVIFNQIFYSGLSGCLLLFKCHQPYVYNSPGPRATEETSLDGCLEGCPCDDDDFFPVCGDDGRTFFSPCHAGCQVTVNGNYANCTCIEGGTAIGGMCDYSCPMFYPFIICYCVAVLFNTFSVIPALLVYIRAVEERDEPLAIGLASFLSAVIGWMLGPICFGKLIDNVCIQWEQSCSGRGACQLYDNDQFRYKLLGYQTLFRVVALMFTVLAYIAARVTKTFEKNKEEEKDDEKPPKY